MGNLAQLPSARRRVGWPVELGCWEVHGKGLAMKSLVWRSGPSVWLVKTLLLYGGNWCGGGYVVVTDGIRSGKKGEQNYLIRIIEWDAVGTRPAR